MNTNQNKTINAPVFTSDFFSQHIPNWEKWLAKPLQDLRVQGLEIGSYEGRSALWLMEHVLTHSTSRLVCVDTWAAGGDLPAVGNEALLDQFCRNLEAHKNKLVVKRGYSWAMLPQLQIASFGGTGFDFVYIDGSHVAQDVLTDAVMSWPMLKAGGILIFDDYEWDIPTQAVLRPRLGIDAFLACFTGYEVIHKGWQVAIRKAES